MAENLKEYLQTHKCKGFNSVPHYSALGDFVTYYFRDARAYEQRVDELLTVYLTMDSNELVGCKIKGVRHILQTAGDFGVALDAGKGVRLGFFFFIGAAAAKDAKQKERYEELGRVAKDAVVDRKELEAIAN
jgi:hypothetical protein